MIISASFAEHETDFSAFDVAMIVHVFSAKVKTLCIHCIRDYLCSVSINVQQKIVREEAFLTEYCSDTSGWIYSKLHLEYSCAFQFAYHHMAHLA